MALVCAVCGAKAELSTDTTAVPGNLLMNVYPTQGFDYWDILFPDYAPWGINDTMACFESSFKTGTIAQTVSLEGYHPETGLDSAYIGAQYNIPYPDYYHGLIGIFFDWLAADSTTVIRTDTLIYRNEMNMEAPWTQLRDTILIPCAAAYGRVRFTGKDQVNWNGTYGPRFRGAYLVVKDGYVAPKAIALNRRSASLYYGETLEMTATVTPAETTWPTVGWECSDSSVATVSADGTVHGVGPGMALIIARTTDTFAPEVRDTCLLTVSCDTAAISGNLLMNVCPTQGFDYWDILFPDYAPWGINDTMACFESSFKTGTIAQTVSLEGYHPETGLDSAYIGAQYNIPYPDYYHGLIGIFFDWLAADSTTVIRTDTLIYRNEMNMEAPWTQLRDTVAIPTRAAYGRVRFTGKDQVNWNGTYGPRFRAAYLAVKDGYVAPKGIALNMHEASLYYGETLQLTATVTPAETSWPTVGWTCSDDSVATVTADGTVRAVGPGTALIIASTTDAFAATVRDMCVLTVSIDTTDMPGNLLYNVFPTGGFDYWTTQFADKYSQWAVSAKWVCFCSSRETGTISQSVSLADYHPASGLDSAYIGVQYAVPGPDDYYGMVGVYFDWLAADSSTVVRTDTLLYKNSMQMETAWTQLSDTVWIPTTAAYGRVRLTGKDQKNWVGAYGPRFRGAYIAVADYYDGSDDETTALDAANDTTEEVTKYLYNGQLFIRRGGVIYTALGQPIKQEK